MLVGSKLHVKNIELMDRKATQQICNPIQCLFLIFDNEVELLEVGCPLEMSVVLNLGLRINKDRGVVIDMENHFLAQNVVTPMFQCLHQGIEFIVIGTLALDNASK
jgi:hypothetical protein